MSKKLKKNNISKSNIKELQESRTGGQIALKGFSYQFLYSCYLILSTIDEDIFFWLEGIEDIDKISINNNTHIQLKYSTQKQDASFLKDILKNYLEVYLLDKKNRNFKLVYDFDVAKGNLKKLFDCNLDIESNKYWIKIIEKIKEENLNWNWRNFLYDDFISKLSFEKIEKNILSQKIEELLIKNYSIATDNISIFANAIKIFCLEKMENRGVITKEEFDKLVFKVKDDISKGAHNPAHSWIKKIDFELKNNVEVDYSYYEGKKPSYQDIIRGLPIKRDLLENEISKSIEKNRVTVIKSSSGQGKTTLAMKVAYDLRKEYTVYQLLWCNDSKELSNIISYFSARVRIGEKPLIIIDNLDSQLSEWNRLAQLFQNEVSYNYKLLITTREDDWYSYSGDLSNVKSLQVIKLSLNEKEAQEIFQLLKKNNKLHSSIKDWKKSFRIIEEKKLLIEYIYLLTHGEMLSERINNQLTKIGATDTGKIKCEILRKICFADICGVKISTNKLINSLTESTSQDYGELLKSIENEFFIRIDNVEKYIEGLHPIRSQHIVEKLHEFVDVEKTALEIVSIVDPLYYPKLFSYFPKLIKNKEDFYTHLIKKIWNKDNLSSYIDALHGVFSGSVLEYFFTNKNKFDDANQHGGLFLLVMDLNPFMKFHEINERLDTLEKIEKFEPNNKNIKYLVELKNNLPKINLPKTDIYFLSKALYEYFKEDDIFYITSDITSYAEIAYWIINIDPSFNLSNSISLELLWKKCDSYSIDTIASIMYTYFLGNKEKFIVFVKKNLNFILEYLRIKTKSLQIYLKEEKNEIHVNYILLSDKIKNSNSESVSRLQNICKILPIFDCYCADAIKPTIDILTKYEIPDNAHKTIPFRNIVIMFHQEFISLWGKTIHSNYEFDSIYECLEHWFHIRTIILDLFNKIILCIKKILEKRQLGELADEINNLLEKIRKELIMYYKYPYEDRPFDKKSNIPEEIIKFNNSFFQDVKNFCNQLVGFLNRDMEVSNLALINFQNALFKLKTIQTNFNKISEEQEILVESYQKLCIKEDEVYNLMLYSCLYFRENNFSKDFNKYNVGLWYESNYKEKFLKASNSLKRLSDQYSVDFPKKIFCDGTLTQYPIVINNFDILNMGNKIFDLLELCVPFTELEYDYLILLFSDSSHTLIHNGLKLTKELLDGFKEAIENENISLINELTPPFPIEVTSQMIECFDKKYIIKIPPFTGFENIDYIGELLWALSKCRQLLLAEQDKKYLNNLEEEYKDKILKFLNDIENKIPTFEYSKILKICKEVFEGAVFLDDELNQFYNWLENRIKIFLENNNIIDKKI